MSELRDLTLDLCACPRSVGADLITTALLACAGVQRVHVDTYVTWALATFDPALTSPDSIVDQLTAAGFPVRLTRVFTPDGSAAPDDPRPDTP